MNGPTTSIAYDYGPDRERIRKVETKGMKRTVTAHAGPLFEQITREDQGVLTEIEQRHAIIAGDQLVATRIFSTKNGVTGGRTEYYHQDALGNVENADWSDLSIGIRLRGPVSGRGRLAYWA